MKQTPAFDVLEPVSVGRPPVESREVGRALRRRIVSGKWSPGERIPTRRELCETLDCSAATLQQVMNTLSDEGFILSMARNGTIVSPTAPHLTEVAVVFPEQPGSNRLWTALSNEATARRDDRFNLRCWYGLDDYAEAPARKQLERDVIEGRVAGIFFASHPFPLKDSPILLHHGPARVFLGSRQGIRSDWPPISSVHLCGDFRDKAIARLRERGRRRLAVIAPPMTEGTPSDDWAAAAERHGCELAEWAYHEVSQGHPVSGRYLARVLFRDGAPDRPDGLIIRDDNLVEQVTLGAADAGLRVPHDLEIVAHCNFPWPPPSALPVIRLGYDAGKILDAALMLLRNTIDGAPPAETTVDVQFEEGNGNPIVTDRAFED